MSTWISRMQLREASTRTLLLKWIVALLIPVAAFTFIWSGEEIVNTALLGVVFGQQTSYDVPSLVQVAIFSGIFYAIAIALAGYLVAADSGRRGMIGVWVEVAVFAAAPLLLIMVTNDLTIGLVVSIILWAIYFYGRRLLQKVFPALAVPPPQLENLQVVDAERRVVLMERATAGGFWFATAFAVVALIADLIFFAVGTLAPILLIWVAARTILLPVAGYFLGRLGGWAALRRVLAAKNGNGNGSAQAIGGVSKRQIEQLSATRAREEAKDLVPNDAPLRSTGAQRFFVAILISLALFYPVIDPFLFGAGNTIGRLGSYGDLGFYIILALGLNIVVGFAGLLDLGYVAFFVIGSYTWAMVGSKQFQDLTGIFVNPQVWPWFFWPMLIIGALIAAFWGVVLGAPTLRLRGDYLAIVTLGFGEIVPIIFLNMDKYTNGTNGIVGIYTPKLPFVDWTPFTPVPFYYLMLALIVLCIFANIRLRDSRLGRAWVAIREDEIAASSSGINLANTKLYAFGAGAFFSGIAGAYHASKVGTITPDNFS
jgi:ABC-type branched-subunit amino acid transport system permease subunit